jgi:hypothetical protein
VAPLQLRRRWTLLLVVASSRSPPAARARGSSVSPAPTSGGSTEPSPAPSSAASSGQSASETITATRTTPRSSGITPIRVIVGDQVFTAELYDSPTAHDLADQLALTVTMEGSTGSRRPALYRAR